MGKSEDKKSFQLYNDYIDHFSLMSDEEAEKLIKAVFCYVNDLPCEELAGLPLMAFSFIRSQLKRDSDKYDARCEINRRNGKLGGRPKKVQTEEPKKPDGMEETQSVLDIPGIEVNEHYGNRHFSSFNEIKLRSRKYRRSHQRNRRKQSTAQISRDFGGYTQEKMEKAKRIRNTRHASMMDGHPMNCAKRLKITRKNWFEREQRVNT